jgi:hypothetical protein
MALLKKYELLGLLLITILFFSACKGGSKDQKGEVIDEEKFIDILVDVHIADAILTTDFQRPNPDLYLPENFYFQVLNNHDISREDFDRSIEYYADDPAVLNKIYQKVSEKISILEGKNNGGVTTNEYGESVTKTDTMPIIPQ